MDSSSARTKPVDALPLIVALWLGYLLAFLVIDHLFYPRAVFGWPYYGINAACAIGVWMTLPSGWGARLIGRAYLPTIIGLMSLVPILSGNLTVRPVLASPAHSPEGLMLRQTPMLIMALVLTAWGYGWRSVVIYAVCVAALSLGAHRVVLQVWGPVPVPPLTVVLIQTVSFLLVGYLISALVRRLYAQQDELARANAQLAAHALAVEELAISRERNRMARELHDTLAHTLSGLAVHLQTMQAYWNVDREAAKEMLAVALHVTRAGLQETRQALKALRATPLADLGLSLALREMAEESAQRASLDLAVDVPEVVPAMSSAVEQCIYRVAQEAMANVAHHAMASTLTLRLAVDAIATLTVRDDGQGFALEDAGGERHYGLRGLRERAALVGGSLTIESSPGNGTLVRLDVPVEGLAQGGATP